MLRNEFERIVIGQGKLSFCVRKATTFKFAKASECKPSLKSTSPKVGNKGFRRCQDYEGKIAEIG